MTVRIVKMSNPLQIHYDAIALALEALRRAEPFTLENSRTARRRLKKAALITIAVTREVAAAANDAALLAECNRAQKVVESEEGT